MALLLFRLRNVPDDEADEVRHLLNENSIEFYETSAGNWGISMPAIWLRNDDDYDLAFSLLHQYQLSRSQRMRAEYEADKAAGHRRNATQPAAAGATQSTGLSAYSWRIHLPVGHCIF